MTGIPFLRCEGCGGMVLLCEHHLDSEEVIDLRRQRMQHGHVGCRAAIRDLRNSVVAERNVAREELEHMEREEKRYKKLLAVYQAKKRAEERAYAEKSNVPAALLFGSVASSVHAAA